MKKLNADRFDDPPACVKAIASAMIGYIRTVAVNDAVLARHALQHVRSRMADLLASRRFSENDTRAIIGILDLAEAAMAPEDQPQ